MNRKYSAAYCDVYQWLKPEFGLVTGFINHLQVVTTNNYYTAADLHNLPLQTNLLSLFAIVFWPHYCSLGTSELNRPKLVRVRVTL
jgi:hypothetical protein